VAGDAQDDGEEIDRQSGKGKKEKQLTETHDISLRF
jgi:hypothetical protein